MESFLEASYAQYNTHEVRKNQAFCFFTQKKKKKKRGNTKLEKVSKTWIVKGFRIHFVIYGKQSGKNYIYMYLYIFYDLFLTVSNNQVFKEDSNTFDNYISLYYVQKYLGIFFFDV